jgi:hypothetical protein
MQILHHVILWELGKVRFKHGLLLLVWWAHREGISIQVPQAKASGGFSHKTADASTSPGVSVGFRTGGLGLGLRSVHTAGVVGVRNQGIHRSSGKADFGGAEGREERVCGSGEGQRWGRRTGAGGKEVQRRLCPAPLRQGRPAWRAVRESGPRLSQARLNLNSHWPPRTSYP